MIGETKEDEDYHNVSDSDVGSRRDNEKDYDSDDGVEDEDMVCN